MIIETQRGRMISKETNENRVSSKEADVIFSHPQMLTTEIQPTNYENDLQE